MTKRSSSSLARGRRACGFSLLELVFVLILVGILAVFAAPRLTTTQSILLPAVGSRLIGNIRYAQSLSMSQGQRYRINFTANTYQITDMSGVAITQPVPGGTALISVAPAIISGYNPPLVNSYLAFDGKGTPYVSATAALASTATITLISGSDSVSVAVAPQTGRVK